MLLRHFQVWKSCSIVYSNSINCVNQCYEILDAAVFAKCGYRYLDLNQRDIPLISNPTVSGTLYRYLVSLQVLLVIVTRVLDSMFEQRLFEMSFNR